MSTCFEVANRLIHNKEYKESAKLYNRLCRMSFSVQYDGAEVQYTVLELEEVVYVGLADLDVKLITLCLMYTQYQASSPKCRAEKLYHYLSWNMCENIKIEEIFTIGPEELEGIDAFMESFVTLLKNEKGDRAGELLIEALLYQGGIERVSSFAKEVCDTHPYLYVFACQRLLEEKRYIECETLGTEGLELLPVKFKIRAKVSNLTAYAADTLSHLDIVNTCYIEAFYSQSNLYHYSKKE